MARPYIEFVQCQNVPWQDRGDGVEIKRLNADPDGSEATELLRYPAGWQAPAPAPSDPAEEWFVLDGAIEVDGERHRRHAYLFRPRGQGGGAWASAGGATLLVFRYAETDPDSAAAVAEPIVIDTQAMPWDVSTYDPALVHLRLSRKVLRMGPNDSGRTFLLAGLPHGIPAADAMPAETHRHCEEMFMLSGEMFAPEGVQRAGAYFFRPPGIVHGPHCSESGFFQIMRSPGANWIKTNWTEDKHPLPIDAAYAPRMPESTPAIWRAPYDPGPRY